MSTKLYSGFRLNMTLEEALPFLKQKALDSSALAEQHLTTACCKKLMNLFTEHKIFGQELLPAAASLCKDPNAQRARYALKLLSTGKPVSWARELVEFAAEMSEKTNIRSEVDLDCHAELNVSLFPYQGAVLGLAFGASFLTEAFLASEGVESYCYWNNTDAPENISPEEWDARGEAWNSVLETGIPAKDGYHFTLFSMDNAPFICVTQEEFAEYFTAVRPMFVRRCATRKLLFALCDEISAQKGGPAETSDVLRCSTKASEEASAGSERFMELYRLVDSIVPADGDGVIAALTVEKEE